MKLKVNIQVKVIVTANGSFNAKQTDIYTVTDLVESS